MRPLTRNQRIVLAALVGELKSSGGVSPTHARLVELCPEIARGSVASTVSALTRRGFIATAKYNNSPITPLKDETGRRLVVTVLEGQ
jgi:hypothetical protein